MRFLRLCAVLLSLSMVCLAFGPQDLNKTGQQACPHVTPLQQLLLPLATCDQLTSEALAIKIVATPEVLQAKQALAQKWLAAAGNVSAEQMAYFQDAVDELTYSLAVGATNSNVDQPKVVNFIAAPHTWFGMKVPGSRLIFDNPDTIYRRIPINPAASYSISGQHHPLPQVDENFSLFDAVNTTISNLDAANLVTSRDGSYSIAIDGNTASPAKNHIQNTAAAASLFIRSTENDWATQTYDSISVQRVGGPPPATPQTFDQLVSRTVTLLTTIYPALTLYLGRLNSVPINKLPDITFGGTAGLLVNQAQTYSRWMLADDEALVVTANLAGAAYFICPVTNNWFITTDYVNHTQTLNNAQAMPNADGTYTFVISVKDPGVYNWVDTVGMHEGTLNLRWQKLPSQTANIWATANVVKLADLRAELPSGTHYVTWWERQLQLAIRAASYARRYGLESVLQ